MAITPNFESSGNLVSTNFSGLNDLEDRVSKLEQPRRVALDELDLERILKGGIVIKNGCEIILKDIGYAKMKEAFVHAIRGFDELEYV